MTYRQRAGVANVTLLTLVLAMVLLVYSQAKIVSVLIKLEHRIDTSDEATQNMLGEILEEVQK